VLRRPTLRAFAERAAVRGVLDPLDADEVIGYVLHRLAVAGTNARVEFEDPALARLAVLSGGVPRMINLLCDRALTLGYEGSASVIDRALIDRAAEDLDISPPPSQMLRLARAAMTIAVLVVLMLAGAAAAALVFHDRFEQTLKRWEAQPSAPRQPLPRQTTPFTPPPTPTPAPDGPASPRK
jgi:general secretion pathway protein A